MTVNQFKSKSKENATGNQKQSSRGVLENFTKFTGKHLCQSLFFNKIAGLKPATLLKKRLWHRCFSVNFANILRTPFFIEDLRWMLLEYMFANRHRYPDY